MGVKKLKQQRIKFIRPRRDKLEAWSSVFAAYMKKYPKDPWRNACTREDAMRLFWGRCGR